MKPSDAGAAGQEAGGASPKAERPILEPGRNCWRVGKAGRASVLIDAADYFACLARSLRLARRSIVIVGWDFDASIELEPGRGERLGDLLRSLVETRPDLEIRVLVWNLATLDAPGNTLPLLLGAEWQEHPRISLRLDARHPFYGAQHQKIVTIDDGLAFVGGIDLTVERWDTPEHRPDDPRRKNGNGDPYAPVHDLQMVVDGEAAAGAAEVARERWSTATRETVEAAPSLPPIWPADCPPAFTDVPVGIARTVPRRRGRRGIREAEALTLDALAAARRTIYIEAQYFAESRIARLLERSLRAPDGPEIVVVVTDVTHGVIEGWIMGGNRDRVIRRLSRADRYDRFRVYHPVVAGPDGECEILVHSKLVIVDDRFLRIGSSNLNRRSTGLDTECDLGVEAADPRARGTIAALRNRLIGEHLGAGEAAVTAAIASSGSMIGAIDRLNGGPRRLAGFSRVSRGGAIHLMPGTRFLDPRAPFSFLSALGRLWRRQP